MTIWDNFLNLFKNLSKNERNEAGSKYAAKERLHLVLMQDRANVSADFMDLMRAEIIEVIKKYVDVDESEIDVRLSNKSNEDGTTGAPSLYANIPILGIKEDVKNEYNKDVASLENEAEKENATSKASIDPSKIVKKLNTEDVKKNLKVFTDTVSKTAHKTAEAAKTVTETTRKKIAKTVKKAKAKKVKEEKIDDESIEDTQVLEIPDILEAARAAQREKMGLEKKSENK